MPSIHVASLLDIYQSLVSLNTPLSRHDSRRASTIRCSNSRTLLERIIGFGRFAIGGCTNLNVVHPSLSRSAPHPSRKILQRCFIAGRHCLDTAVATVSHPPYEAQAARLGAHRIAKPHALHVAGNLEVPCRHSRQCRVTSTRSIASHQRRRIRATRRRCAHRASVAAGRSSAVSPIA